MVLAASQIGQIPAVALQLRLLSIKSLQCFVINGHNFGGFKGAGGPEGDYYGHKLAGHGLVADQGSPGIHIAGKTVKFNAAGQPIQQLQIFGQPFSVHGAVALLHKHGKRLLCGHGPDPVLFAPLQNTHRFQGHAEIIAQAVLTVPGGAAGQNALLSQSQEGLVVIDHHGPLTQDFTPEPGVGGFAGTAFGGEQISFAIHGHHGTVKQQCIIGKEVLRNFPLDGNGFQIRIGKAADADALQSIPLFAFFPLKGDFRRGNPDGKIRLCIAEVVPAVIPGAGKRSSTVKRDLSITAEMLTLSVSKSENSLPCPMKKEKPWAKKAENI